MDQPVAVQDVAFWISLLSGVVGIVLAAVAICFTILVERRSAKISTQTIQSLQKIESQVERVSGDTRDLIKAAWDKLLGAMDREDGGDEQGSIKSVAEGIAAELRAELSMLTPSETDEDQATTRSRLSEALETFERSLEHLPGASPEEGRRSVRIGRAIQLHNELSHRGRAFVQHLLHNRHLSREEYTKLQDAPETRSVLAELREAGVLIPVGHTYSCGHEEFCYYFPPGLATALRQAAPFLDAAPPDALQAAGDALNAIGYDTHEQSTPPGDAG